MTPYATRASSKTLFVGCFLAGCILLLIPHTVTSKLHLAFTQFFGGPLRLGRAMSLSAQEPSVTDTVSAQELAQLQTQVRQLENVKSDLEAQLETERHHLEQLQGLRRQLPLERVYWVSARTLTNSDEDRITIDRGTSDGVMTDLYALWDNAVIGCIKSTSSHRSVIELISSPESLLTVRVGTLTNPVTLAGQGQGRLKITNAQWDSPIKVGDPVYLEASKALATEIIVGHIKSCKRDEHEALLLDIEVEPATDLTRLPGVSVVVPQDWLGAQ